MLDWSNKFADRSLTLKPSAIRQSARYAAQPGAISFASGSPNADLFPYDLIARAAANIMADPKRRGEALQYGPSEGYLPLRELIAAKSDAAIAAKDIVIVNGSQQALEFVAKLLVQPGDRIIVTNPTYLGALSAFNLFQPTYAAIDLSDEGLDIHALERECARGAKFIYLTPDFGNPSGVTLPTPQRAQILRIARRYAVPIFEDQAYAHLWFGAEPAPSLLALDRAESDAAVVIQAGTFSKSLAPGFRMGWIAAPPAIADKFVLLRQASDLQGAALNQMIVHDVAAAALDRQTAFLRDAYRRRRDLMLRALARHMPQSVRWNEPSGGMFIWMTLPSPLDASEVQQRAAQENVAFVPGAPFFIGDKGRATARLSFSSAPEDQIEEGVARLARAVKSCMEAVEPLRV